tara:strand:+ start:16413 stop:17270 length:858 start_codon:yes stop_codon:yes gene_type:complete
MQQLNNLLAVALMRLDPTSDDHWTSDGQARVDVVNASLATLGGDSVTRQDIIDGAPTFTRETAPALIAAAKEAAAPVIPPAGAPPAPEGAPPAPPAASPAAPEPSAPPASDSSLPPLGTPTGAPTAPAPATLADIALDGKGGEIDGLQGSALDVPIVDLMRSVPMLDAAVAEINERSAAIVKERERLAEELKELYAKSELCVRQLTRIRPKDDPNDAVKAYLAQSQRSREERGRRAKAFIAQGTTAQDVAAELRGGSKIDQALKQRGAVPGSTRPSVRVPVTLQP